MRIQVLSAASRSIRRAPVVLTRRTLADASKGASNHPPPPPPTPSSSNAPLLAGALAVTAGLLYYFQDDVLKAVGVTPPAPAAPGKAPATASKSEASKAAPATAAPAAAKPEAPKPTPAAAASAAAKPIAAAADTLKTEAPKAAAEVKKEVEQLAQRVQATESKVDWVKLRARIEDLLDDDKWDDGSWGPVFVRLAWHAAGTYDKNTGKGGSEGATMRFPPESQWGANAGLAHARAKLEPLKKEFPGVSFADLWSFAGTVAIEAMAGPKINWRPGRKDVVTPLVILPDGLLPDADGRDKKANPADHVRDIFYRMGFNDREIVALSGAHALGRCHEDRSGYWGPWTRAPTTFSNDYFKLLLSEKWTLKKTHKGKEWKGPAQYEDKTGELMMLPTDVALINDPKLRPIVEEYAKDEKKFFADFAKAWLKLNENGVAALQKSWWQFW